MRRSASRSVEIFLECLLEDVLVCLPLSSPKCAEADVCAVIDLQRQGNSFLVVRLRPAGWGLFLQTRYPTPILHVFA